jgi:hypothetical protein
MPAWYIKNVSGDVLLLHGVSLDVGQQLTVTEALTPEMVSAKDKGVLDIQPAEATFEERRGAMKAANEPLAKPGMAAGTVPPKPMQTPSPAPMHTSSPSPGATPPKPTPAPTPPPAPAPVSKPAGADHNEDKK